MELDDHRRMQVQHANEPLTPGFLSSSWRITSRGMFAASIVGVFLLSITLEGLRRLAKEYDSYAIRQLRSAAIKGERRATAVQQAVRAILHVAVFGVAYILMLLAMYFNGYIILSIFLGVGVGKYLCDWLVLSEAEGEVEFNPTVCCG